MKKLLIAVIALLSIAAVHAEESTVVQIRGQMPFLIERTGHLIEIETPKEPIVAILDISEACTPERMEYNRQNADQYRKQYILGFHQWDTSLVKLAKAAYDAGVPFAFKFVADCDAEGALVLFSTEDLETMFNKPQK